MTKRSRLVGGILLVLVTALATALRWYRLDAQSLWYDEGFSVYLARMGLGDILSRTAADIQPPLYYVLLHAWIRLFGDAEASLRALSLLFGVASVPLIYALARELLDSRPAGLLAALLLAVSPLHVWYAQEARMYTLLTFLGLLSGWLLLLAVRSGAAPGAPDAARRVCEGLLWAAYALVAAAALYTHYFAFFLLAFQGVYLLAVWAARGFRPPRLALGGLAAGAAALLAYLPWLPHLVTRWGADASYWPGRLKLGEVLVDIAVFFVGGESVSEGLGLALAAGTALVLAVCLVALLARPGRHLPLPFLLLYLLLPPALILLLSYNAPKFDPRYVMLSHPALLLALAGGLAALARRRRRFLGSLWRRAAALVALLFLLAVAGYADLQAYAARDFARPDIRGVAQHIRAHLAPDETVILCSGHMYPIFDYYAPGVERQRLPDSPTLDTTRTLDYSISADLNLWLAGKGGVWVVLWQDEVVDPVGYLTSMLGQVGEEQPVEGSFAQVRLRHYRLPAGAQFSDRPAVDHPADLSFGSLLRLHGYSQTGLQQVTLYWEALQPLQADYLVSLVLRDTNAQEWGRRDGRPSAYEFPTMRWRVGQIVPGTYDLVPLPGTPPGDYGLDVGVYTEEDPVGLDLLDAAGAPQGKRAMLGAVRLSVPAVAAADLEVANPVDLALGDGLALVGWGLDRAEAQPGDRLLLTLGWSVLSRPPEDYRVQLLVTDAASQTLPAGTFPLTNRWHPTSSWQAGQAWRGQHTFRLPIRVQPGPARLSVQLVDAAGAALGPSTGLARLTVLPTERQFTAPQPQALRDADFGAVTLLGADLPSAQARPGELLRLTLYWQARAEMDIPYTVFVHLLGPDGQVVAGHDGQPVNAARPTTGWVPGEYIADPRELTLPAGLAPGEYVLEVGLYDAGAPGMPRLPVLGEGGAVAADRVIFGPVQVR